MSTSPQKSSYLSGSVANMIRSLLVIGAILAVLILVVVRPSSVSQPPVEVESAATAVARDSGWPIERPVGLPEGWEATAVRNVRSTDGLRTWHAGYQTPAGNYVALEQTKDASQEWVTAQTSRAPVVGKVQAAGRSWVKYDRDTKVQRSLVHEDGAEGLTTIVTGTGTWEELIAFAEHLEVVRPEPVASGS